MYHLAQSSSNAHPDTFLVDEYLSWVETIRRRSPRTVDSYRSTLGQWLDYLSGTPIAMATLADLEAFQVRPRAKRGKGGTGAAVTQRREITTLKGFYRWACARGHVQTDPLVEAVAPTVHDVNPKPVPDGIWSKAWNQDMSDTVRTAVGLGFYLGLRRAEIVGLTGTHLTDRRIVGFVRKGGGDDILPWRTMTEVFERHLPHLGVERFIEALGRTRRFVASHPGLPFLTPYRDPDWLNRAMRKEGMPFTPHQLRHSCATNLIRANVPLPIVSRMLNHSSIDITMRYVKAGGDELADWLRTTKS